MPRKITLKNEQISSFLRTDDALVALKTTVDNGQIRLALQILLEIVNDLNDVTSVNDVKPKPVKQDDKSEQKAKTEEVSVQSEIKK